MRDSIYILDRLVKRYGHREACNIAHMEIIRGEILGIIGPSGSGKSTLLRLLNLLEPPTSGSVTFDGTVFDGHTSVEIAVRRRMTMVFQNPLLFNTSVLSNVAYGLKVRGEKDNREKAFQFLDRLGMGDLATSRTVRSLCYFLAKYSGVKLALVAPPPLAMRQDIIDYLERHEVSFIQIHEQGAALEEALRRADVVYQTDLPQTFDYASAGLSRQDYCITGEMLKLLRQRAIIMHPFPRIDGIAPEVDKDPRAHYFQQITNGLYIRMALLQMLVAPGE